LADHGLPAGLPLATYHVKTANAWWVWPDGPAPRACPLCSNGA